MCCINLYSVLIFTVTGLTMFHGSPSPPILPPPQCCCVPPATLSCAPLTQSVLRRYPTASCWSRPTAPPPRSRPPCWTRAGREGDRAPAPHSSGVTPLRQPAPPPPGADLSTRPTRHTNWTDGSAPASTEHFYPSLHTS